MIIIDEGDNQDGGEVIPECDPLVDANCPVDGGEDVIIIEEEE